MPRTLSLSLVTTALLGLSAVSLSSAWSGTAHAQALTWVLDPSVDVETRERIEGQTSDLPFTLVDTAPGAPRSAEQGDPLARATRLAAGSGARVVVWTTVRQGALEVTIVDLEGRRVLVREAPSDTPSERSAALETVGLIVRSALQALAEGGEIGVATPPAGPLPVEPGPAGVPHVEPAPEEPAPLVATEDEARSELMLGAGVGLRSLVNDGPAFEGLGAFALRHGRLWLGASVHASARQHVRTSAAAITLAHAGALLDLGMVALERGVIALVPFASLSLGRVRRETTRVADGFLETRSRSHLDARAGAGLLGRLALGDIAWLVLDVRLELPLQRVRYSVATGAEPAVLGHTPRVAPAVGLSVLARIGRPD